MSDMVRYEQPVLLAKKPLFNFLGRKFWIYGPDGSTQFYVERKAFKLKEDIKVFADETKSEVLLSIKARQILDISATYDVTDEVTGEKVGAMRRKGLKSIIRDEWLVLDANDNETGLVQEDSAAMALIRRFMPMGQWIPQTYNLTVNDQPVGKIKQHFNPFVLKYDVDFSADTQGMLDRRLGIVATVMMLAIEGRQQ
jgi:uncharacterized protein YxjI